MSKWTDLWEQIEAAWRKWWDEHKPTPPTPPAPPDPPNPPTPPASKEHRASFLFDNAKTFTLDALSDVYSEDAFDALMDRCKTNGDTVIYFYTANRDDCPGEVWLYTGALGASAINGAAMQRMAGRMKRARLKGLTPIPWLFADDSKARGLPSADMAANAQYVCDVATIFGQQISKEWGIVLGLELNEYFSTGQVDALVDAWRGVSDKPIGVHATTWQRAAQMAEDVSANLSYGQHKIGLTTDAFANEVWQAVAACGAIPYIAAEYDRYSNRGLGKVALAAGARGYGNG